MVELLLMFTRSVRNADWKLHLHCIRKMLPWIFALDRVNYSRYLSLFWCEMVALKETNADVYCQLESDDFCVQRSSSNFSQVAVDQAI